MLIGSVQCIDDGTGEYAPFLAPANISAFRIPDSDTRNAPKFDFEDANTGNYALWSFGHYGEFRKTMQLGSAREVKQVKSGRYLVLPFLNIPSEIVESDKLSRVAAGFMLDLELPDYIGEITVADGDVIYFGDILIHNAERTFLGVVNNIDNAKAFLNQKSPELAEKLTFKPFSGPLFKLMTNEQTRQLFDNLKEHSRQTLLKGNLQ
jgi:hypothetical protein